MSGTTNPRSTSKSKPSLGIPDDWKRMGAGLHLSGKEYQFLKDYLREIHGIPDHYENWLNDNVLRPWFDSNLEKMEREMDEKELAGAGTEEEISTEIEKLNRQIELLAEMKKRVSGK